MSELVAAIYAITGPPVYCTRGDLDWWRYPHDDQGEIADARLWFENDGKLVGCAWPSLNQVDLIIHPDYSALANEMLAWAEVHRAQSAPTRGTPTMLTAWAFEHDQERRSLLIDRGYEQTDFTFCHRARSLAAPIHTYSLPTGYTLDHMTDDLVESRVAAHRDAFNPSKMTVTKYRALKQAPTYRQEMDLVVRDSEGGVAAFALIWFDEANRVGTFEPVGTRSSHQRRGLARVLMTEGMDRLRALGATTALVVSNGDVEAANRLYDSVGLTVVGRNRSWKKQIGV